MKRVGFRVIALALVVVALASASALASGTVGRWSLIDTARYPGATCFFRNLVSDDHIYQIRVRAPVMYAIDATSKVDHQQVGWHWVIQFSSDNGATWHLEKRGPMVRASATDAYNAQWPSQTGTWKRGSAPVRASYRAVVAMVWFTPSGGIQGQASPVVSHYVDFYNGQNQEPQTHCPDSLG
jgi:hypothetical protein